MIRGLVFSFGVGPLNFLTVALTAFTTTFLAKGGEGLGAQTLQLIGSVFSLGMLLCWLASALVAFGGWQLVRRSGAGVGGVAAFGVGVLIAALLPAVFSVIVLELPLGLTVVLLTTGVFAAVTRPATVAAVSQTRFASVVPAQPAQAGFGRRV